MGFVVAVDYHPVSPGQDSVRTIQGDHPFPRPGHAHPQLTPGHQIQVVGVVGLAQLEHHIVGQVHHRVDGPLSHGQQAVGHPPGRRAGGHVVEHPNPEASAQVGGGDAHRCPLGRGPAGLDHPGSSRREGNPEAGGQVARHPHHGHGVGAVGVHLQVEQHIGSDVQRLGERDPQGQAAIQDQDALVVVTHADLGPRAQHAVAPLAPHLAPGYLHAAGHGGAHCGQGNPVTRDHVEGSAAHLEGFAVAGVHIHQLNPVGIGMGSGGQNLGHHDAIQTPAQMRHLLHRQAQIGQNLGQFCGAAPYVGSELPQPAQQDLHRTTTK